MRNRYYILFLSVLVFLSCKKKEYPESVTQNDRVFYFNADIDGMPVSMAAGLNGYYMYSSYTQNSNKVYSLIADMKPTDCSNCPNSLQIKINDFKVSALNAPIIIDSALVPKTYSILCGPSYSVQFTSAYNKAAAGYLWDFGDGNTSQQQNPVHTYEKAGAYPVSLSVTGTGGCISNINGKIKVGIPGCKTLIKVNNISGNTVSFGQSTTGSSPYSYLWSFGDGTSSSSSAPVHSYTLAGGYPVSLRVIDATGDTAFVKYNVVTQTDLSSCASNYSVSPSAQVSSLDLSKVTVTWIDANGTVYTSSSALQPASSSFQIVSVEDFENNEKGEKTKKIKIHFNCNVYNGSVMKKINSAEAILCVSYN